jgi:hypothetical protein
VPWYEAPTGLDGSLTRTLPSVSTRGRSPGTSRENKEGSMVPGFISGIRDALEKEKEKRRREKKDRDSIAFTIQQMQQARGHYDVVQGIFNPRTNELGAGVKYEAEQIDDKLKEALKGKNLVIYDE